MQLWRVGDTAPTEFDLDWSGNRINTLQTTGGPVSYNGRWVTLGVTLPVAPTYTDSLWKIRYRVGAGCRGTSTDRTVWEIVMLGSPIHNELPPPP
jgi:hypothetical protein